MRALRTRGYPRRGGNAFLVHFRGKSDISECTKSGLEASNHQFYTMLADTMLSRMWPLQLLNRWIRTLSLCGSDPASIKLQLARSSSRGNNKAKWLSDVLWRIADKPNADYCQELSLPRKEYGTLMPVLLDALVTVYQRRKPVTLLTDNATDATATPARSKRTPSDSHLQSLVTSICEDMPADVVTRLTEILTEYASESMTDETFVDDMLEAASIHSELLRPVFRYLTISVDAKQKKAILKNSAKKKSLRASAVEEIETFAKSIPQMVEEDDKKKKLFSQKSVRSPTEWVSRQYGSEHCLCVLVHATADAATTKAPSSIEVTDRKNSTEEWIHPSLTKGCDNVYDRIFLRNLPSDVTVDDIRLAFVACDPEAASKIIRAKPKKVEEKELSREHNLNLSPVLAIHLVKDDLDDVASKFMFDLPREHTPLTTYTDGATDISNVHKGKGDMEQTSDTKMSHDSTVGPDDDLTSDDCLTKMDPAYAFDKADGLEQNFTSRLSEKRVKTALLSKKIPESYAFVVMKNKLVYDNALAKDMRVLGVQVAGSMVYTSDVQDLKTLIFEVNYNTSYDGVKNVSDLGDAMNMIRTVLSDQFSLRAPLWEDASSHEGGKRRRFALSEGPNQPAFIQFSFNSHEDAWRAYELLASHKDTPGFVSWVFSKHYRWVRKQTESFQMISTPMLVDSFFRKGKNGGIKIVPDLRDEYSS